MDQRPPQHVERHGNDQHIAPESVARVPEQRARHVGSEVDYSYDVPPAYAAPTPVAASAASAVTFLAGVWLVLAPFVLDYAPAAAGAGVYWNDLVIGGAIALLALVRAAAPTAVPWASVVNVVLGVWLFASPVVLDYAEAVNSSRAAVNDVIVGTVVVIMAALSAVATFQSRDRQDTPIHR